MSNPGKFRNSASTLKARNKINSPLPRSQGRASAASEGAGQGEGARKHFYLDPYGIKDLDFEMVRQIYERDHHRWGELFVGFGALRIFKAFFPLARKCEHRVLHLAPNYVRL